MKTSSRWLTVKETSEYLGISVNTLNADRYRPSIGIPFYHLGKRVVYDKEELDAFIKKSGDKKESSENKMPSFSWEDVTVLMFKFKGCLCLADGSKEKATRVIDYLIASEKITIQLIERIRWSNDEGWVLYLNGIARFEESVQAKLASLADTVFGPGTWEFRGKKRIF